MLTPRLKSICLFRSTEALGFLSDTFANLEWGLVKNAHDAFMKIPNEPWKKQLNPSNLSMTKQCADHGKWHLKLILIYDALMRNETSTNNKRWCWLFSGIIFSGWKPMNIHSDLDLRFKDQKKIVQKRRLIYEFSFKFSQVVIFMTLIC